MRARDEKPRYTIYLSEEAEQLLENLALERKSRFASLFHELRELHIRRRMEDESEPVIYVIGDRQVPNRAAIESEARGQALEQVLPLVEEIEKLRAELLQRKGKGDDGQVSVFICHAGEDKGKIARPLADRLQLLGLEVWFDEYSLSLGDSVREKTEEGLRACDFGVVILSPAFFAKDWPKFELDGLLKKEMREGRRIILPVWHEMSLDDIEGVYPALSGRVGVHTNSGLEVVVDEIVKAITRD